VDLEQALARVQELEGQVTDLGGQVASLIGERDTAVQLGEQLRGELGELRTAHETAAAGLTEAAAARDAAQSELSEARGSALSLARRALLAENAGQVVPELVAGESVEALEASIGPAREAYGRAVEAARVALANATVPTGAGSGRAAEAAALDGASLLDKISAGLAARS